MLRSTLVAVVLCFGCFEPVDVGRHDGGPVGGGSVGGCTVGQDQTCNASPTMSGLAGQCVAGVCQCLQGFTRTSSGTCAPDCPGSQMFCVGGTPGGLCGDAAQTSTCVAGQWQCPVGTIPTTQCACVGQRPGCTCTASGWQCADAGQTCTPGIAMSCNDGPVDGGVGGIAGSCTASGTCSCNQGFELNPATGRCRATASACTVGQDQTCNAVLSMSSFSGRCVAGACECFTGYTLTPSGTCAPLDSYCVVSDGRGSCVSVAPDGGHLSSGLCGNQTIGAGCMCEAGTPPIPRCLGLCPPAAGRACYPTNCGPITCGAQLRCTSPGVCVP